jgi:serine/threonine-protein kinase RsbW
MRMHLELDLPADAGFLPKTRWALSGYLEELGADPDAIGDAILAIDEACANVVRHAFPHGDGSFHVTADLDRNELVFEVVDDGIGFNPFETTALGVDPHATSGRGLRLIRHLMTAVEVESPRPAGGTRLRMRKQLRGQPPTAPTGQ